MLLTGTLSFERSNDRITTNQFRKNTSCMVSSKLTGKNIIYKY